MGSGVIVDNWWTYLPWSDIINHGGVDNRGKRLRSKLSALELVGPLLVVCCNTEELRGKPIQVHVDNSGSVEIWRKGYSSSCDLSTTLVKTIHQVAVAFECDVDIIKITMCSNDRATMADAISKASFRKFHEVAKNSGRELEASPRPIPKAIKQWIEHPVKDWLLGQKILKELAMDRMVIGYNC